MTKINIQYSANGEIRCITFDYLCMSDFVYFIEMEYPLLYNHYVENNKFFEINVLMFDSGFNTMTEIHKITEFVDYIRDNEIMHPLWIL